MAIFDFFYQHSFLQELIYLCQRIPNISIHFLYNDIYFASKNTFLSATTSLFNPTVPCQHYFCSLRTSKSRWQSIFCYRFDRPVIWCVVLVTEHFLLLHMEQCFYDLLLYLHQLRRMKVAIACMALFKVGVEQNSMPESKQGCPKLACWLLRVCLLWLKLAVWYPLS